MIQGLEGRAKSEEQDWIVVVTWPLTLFVDAHALLCIVSCVHKLLVGFEFQRFSFPRGGSFLYGHIAPNVDVLILSRSSAHPIISKSGHTSDATSSSNGMPPTSASTL